MKLVAARRAVGWDQIAQRAQAHHGATSIMVGLRSPTRKRVPRLAGPTLLLESIEIED